MTKYCDYIFLVNSKSTKFVLDGIIDKNFNKDKVFSVNIPGEAIQQISRLNTGKKITVLLENDLPDNYNI